MSQPLLQVDDLTTTLHVREGALRILDGVTFSLSGGERLGIVGESGAGKTMTALSMTRLLRIPGAEVSGRVLLDGTDLLQLRRRDVRRLLGARIGMIFQNPLNSLNPAMTVGAQISEAIRTHERVSRREAWERATRLLEEVQLPSPARSAHDYPHRLSGGMRQRVVIAMALACQPGLLIADEPTTALDVTTQAEIVDLIFALAEVRGMSVILITHDLALMAGFADRIVVLHRGRVVEEGSVRSIYASPRDGYTRALISSVARLAPPAWRGGP
ncbi:MAG TPA: ABC transporter ATP-binding protein [Actinomycetota bacterium]|nr:ABC transporter ATP-binding protein [Actinomycetota bacterium]